MLLQVKNKKGLSIVISYVLLIGISIALSILVYQWIKTYVPVDSATCEDGTSFFVKNFYYNCSTGVLNVTLKNNGRFGIDGFYIRGLNSSVNISDKVAAIDLSQNLITATEAERAKKISGSSVRFSSLENSLSPEEKANTQMNSFNVSKYSALSKLEIIPTRLQVVNKKKTQVICGDNKIEQLLTCS